MINDTIGRMPLYAGTVPELEEISSFLRGLDPENIADGTGFTPGGVKYSVQTFMSAAGEKDHEVHRKMIDVQLVLEGREKLTCSGAIKEMPLSFSEEKDYGALKAEDDAICHLRPGNFALIFPYEPHCPGLSESEKPERVRKIVFKIPFGEL